MASYKEELQEAIEVAKGRLPLPDLCARRGLPISPNQWVKCPFCEEKGKFNLKETGRFGWQFGCMRPTCSANKPATGRDEIGLICLLDQLSDRSDGIKTYFQEAGVEHPGAKFEKREEAKLEASLKKMEKAAAEREATERPRFLGDLTEAVRNPYEECWRRMTLTEAHREQLIEKRGLSLATIEKLGFKSSIPENWERLKPVLELFPRDELLKSGVARPRSGVSEDLMLSPQLCGYGNTGDKDKSGKAIFSKNVHPIVIPYVTRGVVTFLRPHKGGLNADAWKLLHPAGADELLMTHVYCPDLLKETLAASGEQRVILTEGEFKAAVLYELGIPALAMPGIQQTCNKLFRAELVGILREYLVQDLVVVFDNEEKGNPNLDGYKPDPFERYNAEVYARYVASDLSPELLGSRSRARVGHLPDAWRDGRGKADWDGAYVREFLAKAEKAGKTRRQAQELARRGFAQVVAEARPPTQQMDFLGSEKERIIQCRLQRLTYKPHLIEGGEEERKTAAIIRKCHPDFRWSLMADRLADAYDETYRCYFQLKPPTPEQMNKYAKFLKVIRERLEEVVDEGEPDEEGEAESDDDDKVISMNGSSASVGTRAQAILEGRMGTKSDQRALRWEVEQLLAAKRTAEALLMGWPKPVSTFVARCEYKVEKPDGKIERLLSLRDNLGGPWSPLCQPSNAEMTSPKNFREFIGGVTPGEYAWLGGQDALDGLFQDVNRLSAYRLIKEVDFVGYHRQADIFIGSDCAFTMEDGVIFPDENQILWHQGVGYRLDPELESSFAQGGVHFYPDGPQRIDLEAEKQACREIFGSFLLDLHHSLGSMDLAAMMMGMTFSYAAGPTLLREFRAQPGMWIYGKPGSGKTSLLGWLRQIWGFEATADITSLTKGTTVISVDRTLTQYSFLPAVLDEFRENNANKDLIDTLRNCFNQASKSKARWDQSNKVRTVTPRTNPIVSGQGVTTDAATKSRFLPFVVSSANRLGTDREQAQLFNRIVNQEAQHYHRLGRYVMLNWGKFQRRFAELLHAFMENPETVEAIPYDRLRLVYGTAFCAFQVLQGREFFGQGEREAEWLLPALYAKVEHDAREVEELDHMALWWQDVIAGIRQDRISAELVVLRSCVWDEDGSLRVITEDEAFMAKEAYAEEYGEVLEVVFVGHEDVYSLYEVYVRQRGREPHLDRTTISAQLRKEDCWIPPRNEKRQHFFQLGRRRHAVWALDFTKLEPWLQTQLQNLWWIDESMQADDEDA